MKAELIRKSIRDGREVMEYQLQTGELMDGVILKNCKENLITNVLPAGALFEGGRNYVFSYTDQKNTLRGIFSGGVSAAIVLKTIESILHTLQRFQQNSINLSYMVFDPDYIYWNNRTNSAEFACFPIKNTAYDTQELADGLRKLLSYAVYGDNENGDYVAKLLTAINRGADPDTLLGTVEVLMNAYGIEIMKKKSALEPEVVPQAVVQPVVDPQQAVEPQPVVEPQQAVEPQPVVEPEVVPQAVVQPVVEPQQAAGPQPVAEPEIVPQAVVQPVVEPQPIVEPQLVAESQQIAEPQPVAEPEIVPQAVVQPVVEPQQAVEPQPVVEPQQAVEPQPVAEPQQRADPQPVVEPEVVPQAVEQPVAEPQQAAEPQPVAEPEVVPQVAAQPVVEPQPEEPKPYLLRTKTGEKIMLPEGDFIIGKSVNNADYVVTDNTAVSRVHCTIYKNKGAFFVRDERSTNSTFVNGEQVLPGMDHVLINNCKLVLGDEEFTYHLW